MTRSRQTDAQLRGRILDAFMCDIGISEQMARPFVDAVMRCFAGEQPYFPAIPRSYPVMHIKAAMERGMPVKRVLSEFDVSRTTLHKLFPGGLPHPENPVDDH